MSDPQQPEAWLILLRKSKDESFIMTDDALSGAMLAFTTKEEALTFFEQSYNTLHSKGAQGSASAMIHWMTFDPMVVPAASLNVMNAEWFQRNERGAITTYSLTSIAGRLNGVPLTPETAAALVTLGTPVQLISRDMVA